MTTYFEVLIRNTKRFAELVPCLFCRVVAGAEEALEGSDLLLSVGDAHAPLGFLRQRGRRGAGTLLILGTRKI